MIKNVLTHIENIAVFPIISLILFALVFTGMVLWTMSMKKSDAAACGRIPLEDATEEEGGHRHD